MPPLFSIVIPTLNEAQDLPKCLQCLSTQTFSDFEIILCDAGSDDETLEIARGFRCKIVNTSRGRALQMNQGASVASGNILLFLHADTQLAPNALQQIREVLHPPQISAGAFYVKIDASGWLFWCITQASNWRCRLSQYPYGDQGIFIRRPLFIESGGFPEIRLFEEILFFRKIRPTGKIALIRNPPIRISARRWKEEGVWYTILRNAFLTLAFYLGVQPNTLARYYPARKPRSSVNFDVQKNQYPQSH